MIEYVPSNCFITRFRADVTSRTLLSCSSKNCIDANVHTVVLLGKYNDDDDDDEIRLSKLKY